MTIYLDYNSTTPLDQKVLSDMMPFLTDNFGNAASRTHIYGQIAEKACKESRDTIAKILNTSANGIIFTSGATESNNLAICGVSNYHKGKGKHIITSLIEHKSVIDPCKQLEKEGFVITWLKPNKYGEISAKQVSEAVRSDTILVTIMMANNEIGTINQIKDIVNVAHEHDIIVHTDATQAVGKYDVDIALIDVDLMSFSAHKFYGPKGIGGLFVRPRKPRIKLMPQTLGGGHERGLRSGTLNVPGIVGMASALKLSSEIFQSEYERIGKLRKMLWDGLSENINNIHINGHPSQCLANTLNIAIEGIDAEALIGRNPGIAISTGSACTSDSIEPSHVLQAIGLSSKLSKGSIRVSLGRYTTEEDIQNIVESLVYSVNELRDIVGG